MSSKRDLEILFDLLTELEKLGCFEIKTKERGNLKYIESSEIERDFEIWWEFIDRIHKRVRGINKEKIAEIFDRQLSKIIVGTKALLDFDLEVLKKVLNELKSSEEEISKPLDYVEEIHIEELIRKNFEKIFPNLEIIDDGKHYRTKVGAYIDILAKKKDKGEYTVIEIKRGIHHSMH
ncbi:MAG: hypothetical protein NZ879_05270 [Archaeoglobaceae archaeon]|nr:hypothetical protein [Archaeoglobaceae archaeon]MDW8118377.1 hypothetical protein [Archaeoglobaceae archaeon]